MSKKSKVNRYAALLQSDSEEDERRRIQDKADFKQLQAVRHKLDHARRLHEDLATMLSKGHSRECRCRECFGLRIQARKALAEALKEAK